MKQTVIYVDNDKLLEELAKYKRHVKDNAENNLPKPKIPDYLGDCFLKIANNLAKKPSFYAYTYRDEMIGDAIENCVQYFENFDPEKSRYAFAYFTLVCWRAFVRRIAKEKKQQYVKYKATESFGVLGEEELSELDEVCREQIQVYDNIYEFIAKYEKADKERKEKIDAPRKAKVRGVEKFIG